MPEVADGAGLLFDPHQTDDMARALADILLDGELRGRMERLGLQRAAGFTWRKKRAATLDVYRDAIGAPAPELAQVAVRGRRI